jgi:hypothetical protein
MYVVDVNTLAALTNGNLQLAAHATVITPSGATDVPVLESQSAVTYDITSSQVRRAVVSVDRSVIDAGLMNPLTDRVYVRLGVVGGQDIPLFTGRVLNLDESDAGIVQVSCVDYADDLITDSFNVPWSTHGGSVASEITRIVQDTDSSFNVDFSTATPSVSQLVPSLTWEEDRGSALDDLSGGSLCLWSSDRVGDFRVYQNPFSVGPSLPVAVFKDGIGGTIVTMQHSKSRDNIYNSITLIVERTDGTYPLRVTVTDSDPSSPTRIGGPFGQRNRNVKIQTTLDAGGAYNLAVRLLRQSLALTETWQWSTPCFPHLDPSDNVAVWYRDVVAPVVIDTVTIPLTADQPTQFTGRRLQLLDPSLIGIS